MREPRRLNPMLDRKPTFGPFPQEMIFPVGVLAAISSVPMYVGMDFRVSFVLLVSLVSSWYLLTFNGAWRFTFRFYRPPRYIKGSLPYLCPLEEARIGDESKEKSAQRAALRRQKKSKKSSRSQKR